MKSKNKTGWIENYWSRFALYLGIIIFFGLFGTIESEIIVTFGLLLGEINYRFEKINEKN